MNQAAVKVEPDRNSRRRAKTREALLAAADEVFRRKGVSATTVTDITDQADVAYGSFYNHFKDIAEAVSALAEATMHRVVEQVSAIMSGPTSELPLTATLGVRIMLRLLSDDPASRWLIERPKTLVDEYKAIITPFMREVEGDAPARGEMNPAGGQETWLRVFPWILLAELEDVLLNGNLEAREESLTRISLRLHGVPDSRVEHYLEASAAIVGKVKGETPSTADRP